MFLSILVLKVLRPDFDDYSRHQLLQFVELLNRLFACETIACVRSLDLFVLRHPDLIVLFDELQQAKINELRYRGGKDRGPTPTR